MDAAVAEVVRPVVVLDIEADTALDPKSFGPVLVEGLRVAVIVVVVAVVVVVVVAVVEDCSCSSGSRWCWCWCCWYCELRSGFEMVDRILPWGK